MEVVNMHKSALDAIISVSSNPTSVDLITVFVKGMDENNKIAITVSQLCKIINKSKVAVYAGLKTLRDKGIIKTEKIDPSLLIITLTSSIKLDKPSSSLMTDTMIDTASYGYVYYISKNGELLYIGSSANFKIRSSSHECRCVNGLFYVAEIKGVGEYQRVEKALINKYRPPLNYNTYEGFDHVNVSIEDFDFKYHSESVTDGKKYIESRH